MKCATCCKAVSTNDHQDVQFALGAQPQKIYECMEKILSLNSSGLQSEEKDQDGNPVICGTCYTNTFVQALKELGRGPYAKKGS